MPGGCQFGGFVALSLIWGEILKIDTLRVVVGASERASIEMIMTI